MPNPDWSTSTVPMAIAEVIENANGDFVDPHLIGAYGMFWERKAVYWTPGQTPKRWQLLGHRNTNKPALRVCDFRQAKGFYVLFDEFRATYVGLARGVDGIGGRLKDHNKNKDHWNRFCWFSFDDCIDVGRSLPLWQCIKPRDALRNMNAETVLRESEALLITILGTDQNDMRFQGAHEWQQLTAANFVRGGVGLKVPSNGYTDDHYQWLADTDND